MKRLFAVLSWWIPLAVIAAEPLTFSGRYGIEKPQQVLSDTQGVASVSYRLRLSSYNLQDFTDGVRDGEARTLDRVARQARGAATLLDEINPDIAVFQELENGDVLRRINAGLSRPFPLGYITSFHARGNQDSKLNIGVLSRVPVSSLREIDFEHLEGVGRPPRGLLSFVVNLGDKHRLLVYGVHLKSNWGDGQKNRFQRYHALRMLREDADKVVAQNPSFVWEILMLGDMNIDPEAPGFKDAKTLEPLKGWMDLWKGRPLAERMTLPTRYGDPTQEFPPITFDRFFASPELQAEPWVVQRPQVLQRGVDTNISVVSGQNDVHVSDHYPVYIDLLR